MFLLSLFCASTHTYSIYPRLLNLNAIKVLGVLDIPASFPHRVERLLVAKTCFFKINICNRYHRYIIYRMGRNLAILQLEVQPRKPLPLPQCAPQLAWPAAGFLFLSQNSRLPKLPHLKFAVDLRHLQIELHTMAATEKRPELIAIARDLNGVPMCDDYEKMISGML